MQHPLTEAERQAMIVLIELAEPVETPNNTHYRFYPKTVKEAESYFRSLREDWLAALAGLAERGLARQDTGETGYTLTQTGAAVARQERSDHPPIWYWYREYYTITARSRAYARFCEQLYGRDLCQTDFSDMAQIDFMLRCAALQPGQRALDLGCGKGLLAEYLSDCTGARIWGVDYIPEAIQQALERTTAKRDRLNFQVGNFDHLEFPEQSFDLLISVDTLYMPGDLPATLRKLGSFLVPGGRMLVFYSAFAFDPSTPREALSPDGTDLARALKIAGFSYRTWDFTEPTFHLMRRKRQLAEAMRPAFEQEGTLFLYDHLMAESDGGEAPFQRDTVNITRYLYEITP